MKSNVVVATHHKTGTVWMASVFGAIAKRLGVRYVDFWSHYGRLDGRLKPPFILFNHDSKFLQHSNVLRRADVRILHVIRDPRDVLISAMHYHRTADEPWLRQVPGDGGPTYQDRLNALATPFQQYLFELENAAGRTIDDMLDWQDGRANCREVRYEELRLDHSMVLWSHLLTFLGFEESEQELCRECFWKNSLFGGAVSASNRHVRSGDVAQWEREFTPELADAFVDRFPDALHVLGYETDDRWIERLRERSAAE